MRSCARRPRGARRSPASRTARCPPTTPGRCRSSGRGSPALALARSARLTPVVWNAALIRQAKEYSGLLNAFELWESEHGQAAERPVALFQTAGTAATENSTFTAGPDAVLSHQPWGIAPTYAASTRVSNQLIQDAFVAGITPQGGVGGSVRFGDVPSSPTLDDMLRSLLGESLGRVLAPVATTAFYAAINAAGAWSAGNSGGFLALGGATPVQLPSAASTELIQKTIALDTAAQMVAEIDAAYLDGAAWYMTQTAWQGLTRQVDATNKRFQLDPSAANRSLMNYPVVLTAGATDAVLSTVSGPVFGNLAAAMTLRVANGQTVLLRSTEKFAEILQTYYRVALRADVSVRDSRAMIGVRYNST